MFFNSIEFIIFFIITLSIFWTASKYSYKLQNIFLLIASYFFYYFWNWNFLILLILTSLLSFFTGLIISHSKEENNRNKIWLITSIVLNISVLVFYKYFNFFSESFINILNLLNLKIDKFTLDIILPLGISFFTFQNISYCLDVYRNKNNAVRNFISYGLYISYFPKIIAGPIERSSKFVSQIEKRRYFDYDMIADGSRQILWGLFKKMVIADNCAVFTNQIFDTPSNYNSSALLIGSLLYTFQIYCDFSGYSDMAIGISKFFGINLSKNFDFPYFSRNISEFWKKWHITLTHWFRDYFFLPLSYKISRKFDYSKNNSFFSADIQIYSIGIFLTWTLTGLWHGANLTFIVWGILHAILLILHKFNRKRKRKLLKKLNVNHNNKILTAFEVICTFLFVNIFWIYFRSSTVTSANNMINSMISKSIFITPNLPIKVYILICVISFFSFVEWKGRFCNYGIEKHFKNSNIAVRWGFYSFLIFLIGMYAITTQSQFIYRDF